MVAQGMGLRERRKARTRREIQEHALRLFLERGYEAVTVADVAQAAEVSSMTVFRYFPSKEDLVLSGEVDPLIGERLRAQPATVPLMRRLAMAFIEAVAELSEADRQVRAARVQLILATPALRARLWDAMHTTENEIVDALCGEVRDQAAVFHLRVAAAASLAAATAAFFEWVDSGGRGDPRELVSRALAVVAEEATR